MRKDEGYSEGEKDNWIEERYKLEEHDWIVVVEERGQSDFGRTG